MVKIVAALIRARTVAIYELVGAAFVVTGLGAQFGAGVALIGAGAAVLAKSLELDLARRPPGNKP